jgi:allantoin racemase
VRILLLNPNTSASVTALVVERTDDMAGAAATFMPVTARFSAAYIASRTALAIASNAGLDAVAEHGSDCEAVLLACFGDPDLLTLRELAPASVVAMLEASCLESQRTASRYAIVTEVAL